MIRTVEHTEFTSTWIRAHRSVSVSVVVPARNESATIGTIAATLVGLRDEGVVDEVLVLDDSDDATPDLALAAGADVVAQSSVLPHLGPVLGKGDALYRGLAASSGEVVVFVDGDSTDFGSHYVTGLLGPVVRDGAAFVKGSYRRPWREASGDVRPSGGGRVTELCALPALRRFAPELASVEQPLSGEVAATRALLERLPFTCGYGVDIGLLVDAWRAVGTLGLAQTRLGTRQNRHQPLEALGPMADAVLDAVLARTVPGAAAQAVSRRPLAGRLHRATAA